MAMTIHDLPTSINPLLKNGRYRRYMRGDGPKVQGLWQNENANGRFLLLGKKSKGFPRYQGNVQGRHFRFATLERVKLSQDSTLRRSKLQFVNYGQGKAKIAAGN
jgi:hypothetical protein